MTSINEIKKRVAESSKNWFAEWNWDVRYITSKYYVAWGEGPTIRGESLESIQDQAIKDKEFIAHAKDDIKFLLGEVEILREKVRDLEEELEEHWDY